MSEPTAQPESPLVRFLFDEILNLSLPPLQIGPEHVKSVETRPPIQSEYHKPRWRQVETLGFNPGIFQMLQEHLKEQLSKRKCITDQWQPEDIRRWTDAVKSGMGQLVPARAQVTNEESVKQLYSNIHNKTGLLATFICLDMSMEDLQRDPQTFKSVFTLFPSSRPTSKADNLVGFVSQEPDDGPEKWGSLWQAMVDGPIDLRQDFFKVLFPEEYKNPLALCPDAVAGIYLTLLCVASGFLRGFWPDTLCRACDKFRKSHEAQGVDWRNTPEEVCPPDGSIAARARVMDMNRLRTEFFRVLRLNNDYEKKCNIPPGGEERWKRKRRHSGDSSGDEDDTGASQMAYEQKLNAAFDKAQKELKLDASLRKWMIHGAYMLIQLYAQMDMDRTTAGYLSCGNGSVVCIFDRASRTLTLSEFLQNDDKPLLLVTALTVFAWTDAVERFERTPAEDTGRPVDPYRGQTKKERDAEDRLAGKAPAKKQSETRPPKKPKTGKNKEPSQDEDDVRAESEASQDDDDVDDHSTSDDAHTESDPSQDDADVQQNANDATATVEQDANPDEDAAENAAGDNNHSSWGERRSAGMFQFFAQVQSTQFTHLRMQELHVAFNAPKRVLVSNGFEHYERIPSPNIPATPAFRFADLSDVDEERPTTPPTKFSSISDVDGSPQLAAISSHRLDGRKASIGSVASRSDTSKRSVRSISSVPSLSSTASTAGSDSPPPTPSTTSSFPSGSKESSPLAKKRTQTAVGEVQVDPLQTILPKIQYAGVFIEEVIYEKMGRPTVWSGQLILEDDTVESTIPIPIVVKMAVVEYQEGDESDGKESANLLRHEGVIYEALAKAGLRGITPRYYGAFESDLGAVMLVLDDGGETIGSFGNLSKEQRQDLLTMAETMHRAGIVHNDLKPLNVVQDSSGEVKIIDFDMAVDGHRCPGKECEELIEFAKALKLDAEA
ncbi:hypothetical protein R3P38DRAFT_2702199 [Favolaschia claudopus]|uniref:Protein kinase domain-containing protein n=1 Tax=Favolaschia claudopus TaxID=2862362 RepID=A0AAW0BYY6_9AGAR